MRKLFLLFMLVMVGMVVGCAPRPQAIAPPVGPTIDLSGQMAPWGAILSVPGTVTVDVPERTPLQGGATLVVPKGTRAQVQAPIQLEFKAKQQAPAPAPAPQPAPKPPAPKSAPTPPKTSAIGPTIGQYSSYRHPTPTVAGNPYDEYYAQRAWQRVMERRPRVYYVHYASPLWPAQRRVVLIRR